MRGAPCPGPRPARITSDDKQEHEGAAHQKPSPRIGADRVDLRRLAHQIPADAQADEQHERGQQEAQLLALEASAGRGPELRADDAADDQQHRQHDIDRLVLHGLQQRRHCRHEDDLEQRGADDDAGRHAQQVDHGRHHDEAAADAHDRRHEADEGADHRRRDGADVELRAVKAHLERQAVHPAVLAGLACRSMPVGAAQGADALDQHQRADDAEEGDVAERDEQIELTRSAAGSSSARRR